MPTEATVALAVCPLNMVVFPNKGFSKWGLFSQSIGYLSWPTCLGLGSLPSWAWGMPWLRVIAMVSLSTGDALNLAMWLCLGCFLVGVVMALEAKHMGMPCPWQRTHEGYLGLGCLPIGKVIFLKKKVLFSNKGIWAGQHATFPWAWFWLPCP